MNLEELSQRLSLDYQQYITGFQQATSAVKSHFDVSSQMSARLIASAREFDQAAGAAARMASAVERLTQANRSLANLSNVQVMHPSHPAGGGFRIAPDQDAWRKEGAAYENMTDRIARARERALYNKSRDDAAQDHAERTENANRRAEAARLFGVSQFMPENNQTAVRNRINALEHEHREAAAEMFGISPRMGLPNPAALQHRINALDPENRARRRAIFGNQGVGGNRGYMADWWKEHPLIQGGMNVAHGMGGMISGTARGVTGAVGGLFDTSSTAGLLMTITGITAAVFTLRAAFHGVSDAIHKVVENGMEFERMRVTFEVLSRDVEKGRTLFGELQQMSVRTPFTFKQLGDTSQLLLGMGVSPENAPGMLSRMTDVAAGDPGRLRRLAFAMGASGAEGRLTGQRVRQFASLGIGIPDFAKTMGISGGEFRERMHGGGIPSFYVEETIKRMTDSGGRFFERNERGLETVSGQWNRLGGIIDLLAGKFGEAMMSSMGLAKGIKDVGDLLLTLMPSAERFGKSFGGFLGAGMQEAGALGGGLFAGAGKFLGRHHDDIVGAMPGMDQVMSGLHRFGDALLWITDLIGTIGANMIKGAGEAAKYAIIGYAHLSHSPIGKLMGMEPMTMHQGKAAMSFMAPILKFTRGAPGAWNEFMGDVRGEVDSRRHPTFTSRMFAGAERFLGGLGGRPGFTSNTQSTIDNLESDIVKNKMSSDPMFAFMHERNNLMDEYWGRGGKAGAEKSAEAWRRLAPMAGLDPDLFHAMPGGPLAGAPGMVRERGAQLFETLEKSVSPLLNFRDHLAPVAMAGSGEAADAIAKAQLDFKSVEEEVLAVVQTANEMHAHASARLDEIAAALQNNKLLMVEK